MPSAEIIAIGTELLLGEIQDTNTYFLARKLRDLGIDLYRTIMIGDNTERIAQAIRESLTRAQIIITTGGLGPTVDDPTRQAVALAVGVEIEFQPSLWEQIQTRFSHYGRQATENNRRQAYIPQGAIAIENPVGTAPAFRVELGDQVIISLPGVPREMQYLIENSIFPYLKARYGLHGTIKARVLHTSGVGESQVDEWVGDLETLNNPTVGLLAHPGQVDIRITAKAESIEEADHMIERVAMTIRERLGTNLFGEDEETLEMVTLQKLTNLGWRLSVIECGLEGAFISHLKQAAYPVDQTLQFTVACDASDLKIKLKNLRQQVKAEVTLALSLLPAGQKQVLSMILITPTVEQEIIRSYGGAPALTPSWAVNQALDFLRRNL